MALGRDENTLVLTSDWDKRIDVGMLSTNYQPRLGEESHVVDFIRRKSNGSLLIGGKRGIGKTSLVNASINKASPSGESNKLIPILIDASFMNIGGVINEKKEVDHIKTKQLMLQTLVRALHNKTKQSFPKDLQEKISSLYKKITAEKALLENQSEAILAREESKKSEMIRQINLKLIGKFIISGIVAIFSAMILNTETPSQFLGPWKFIIPLIILASPLVFSISWKKGKQIIEEDLRKDSLFQRYVYDDLNPLTTEVELEEILKEMSSRGFKTIFVIDELDKLNVDDLSVFFGSLKGLFNRLTSLFIFVCDEAFYSKYEDESRGRVFSVTHTIFSQKIFLGKPTSNEVSQYLEKITSEKKVKSSKELEQFNQYLIFRSRGHYYDLLEIIRSRIIEFNNQNLPVISIDLNNNEQLQANFQWLLDEVLRRRNADKISSYQKDELTDKIYNFFEELNDLSAIHLIQVSPMVVLVVSLYGVKKEFNFSDKYSINIFYDILGYLFRIRFVDQEMEGQYTPHSYYRFEPLSEVTHPTEKDLLEALEFFKVGSSLYSDLYDVFLKRMEYNDEISKRKLSDCYDFNRILNAEVIEENKTPIELHAYYAEIENICSSLTKDIKPLYDKTFLNSKIDELNSLTRNMFKGLHYLIALILKYQKPLINFIPPEETIPQTQNIIGSWGSWFIPLIFSNEKNEVLLIIPDEVEEDKAKEAKKIENHYFIFINTKWSQYWSEQQEAKRKVLQNKSDDQLEKRLKEEHLLEIDNPNSKAYLYSLISIMVKFLLTGIR